MAAHYSGHEDCKSWIRSHAGTLAFEGQSTDFSCVIPIQTANDRSPLLCFHPIGGGILCYRELAKQLGPEHSVYWICKAVGLHGEQEPLASIAQMAEHHLGRLLEIQNEGPFFPHRGWSAGGLYKPLRSAQQAQIAWPRNRNDRRSSIRRLHFQMEGGAGDVPTWSEVKWISFTEHSGNGQYDQGLFARPS
jgi:hypothetical protein